VPAAPPRLDPIDQVLALDLGGRGIASFFRPGAGLRAARALLKARRVLIATGFCVPPGVPETDGLPGAGVLGQALRRLGAEVRWITDPPVVEPLRAVLDALELAADIEVTPEDGRADALLGRTRPTHLVAIERPGRARSGDYLSARGESVAAWNGPLDALFLRRAGRRPVTIGVGDGGNEIGMGNVRTRLVRESPLMAKIASVVRVDHLVVAGTSNWGAYGIVAGLSRLSGQSLLHTPEVERRLIEACVVAGAVDGLRRWPKPTVDGLDIDVHAAVVQLLRCSIRARDGGA
jgi:hypothetical protein